MGQPQVPQKHPELVEVETRRRSIREQRVALEGELREVERRLAELATCDADELDELADQLASGKIEQIVPANLPTRRDDLRAQLAVVTRADRKAAQHLTTERERYAKTIVRAFQPAHIEAVKRVNKALEELVRANEAEAAVRLACPVQLVNLSAPNIGDFSVNGGRMARAWREHVSRLGYLSDAAPAPKANVDRLVPHRGAKANGSAAAAEPPALVARGAD